MTTKHEHLVLLKNKLKQKSLSLSDMSKLTGLNIRSIQRYLPLLKEDENFHQINPGKRPSQYRIETKEAFSPQNITIIEQARDELALGGNHRHSEVLQGVLDTLQKNNSSQIHLPKYFELDHGPLSESQDYSKNIHKYLSHIQKQDILEVTYRNSQNTTTLFKFHPYKLVLRVGRLYLIGDKEGAITSLRVNRIKRITKKGQGYTLPKLNNFYKYTFGPWKPASQQPENIQIKCLSPWVINLFQESHFNPPVTFTQDIVNLRLFITPDFENWLMGQLPHIQIQKPTHLLKSIQDRLKTSLQQLSS